MNEREKYIMANGETGQGEGLMDAKMKKENSQKYGASKERSQNKGSSSSKYSPPVHAPLLSGIDFKPLHPSQLLILLQSDSILHMRHFLDVSLRDFY